jgi:hypothetical protein
MMNAQAVEKAVKNRRPSASGIPRVTAGHRAKRGRGEGPSSERRVNRGTAEGPSRCLPGEARRAEIGSSANGEDRTRRTSAHRQPSGSRTVGEERRRLSRRLFRLLLRFRATLGGSLLALPLAMIRIPLCQRPITLHVDDVTNLLFASAQNAVDRVVLARR